jgi:hypothetical protein
MINRFTKKKTFEVFYESVLPVVFWISGPLYPFFPVNLIGQSLINFIDLKMSSFLSNTLRLRNFAKDLPHAFPINMYFVLHPIQQKQRNFEMYPPEKLSDARYDSLSSKSRN